jgi:hypothetical protein
MDPVAILHLAALLELQHYKSEMLTNILRQVAEINEYKAKVKQNRVYVEKIFKDRSTGHDFITMVPAQQDTPFLIEAPKADVPEANTTISEEVKEDEYFGPDEVVLGVDTTAIGSGFGP